jgi:hypothetical protein
MFKKFVYFEKIADRPKIYGCLANLFAGMYLGLGSLKFVLMVPKFLIFLEQGVKNHKNYLNLKKSP